MSKDSRSGGKYSGNHTTLLPAAAKMCDVVHADMQVYKISPGIIQSGLHPISGRRRVKVRSKSPTYLLLSIRNNAACQEVHVFTSNLVGTKSVIEKGAQDAGLRVSFVEV